jgi:queuosine precursor transporter
VTEEADRASDPKRAKLYLVLGCIFTTCLVVGDLIGVKLIDVPMPGWTAVITVGLIPFPVTFLLTDLLNEFYGKQAARRVTFIAFGCALLTYSFVWIAGAIPISALTQSPSWGGTNAASFANVFLGGQRMILASLSAYMVSQLIDIFAFHSLKKLTKGKLLWLRATGSTLASQAIDTVTVNLVAWTGLMAFDQILNIMLSSYAVKILIAIGLTPVIYAGHALIERMLGLTPIPVADEAELAPAERRAS